MSPETTKATSTTDERDDAEPVHHSMLVFEASASFMFPLPSTGEVEIGRHVAGGLKLEDSSVSRRHAKLVIDDEVTLVDLGSQNGVRVNGERVVEARRLAPADLIMIGNVTLVYHADRRAQVARRLLEFPELRRKLDEEIERVLQFQRAFGVLFLALGDTPADRTVIDEMLEKHLRKLDVCAWVGTDELLVLMPETSAGQAVPAAQRMRNAITQLLPDARIGYAVCPDDACEADALIGSARSAALAAERTQVAAAAKSPRSITIGSKTVVVADPAMVRLYAMIDRLAPAELPVLFHGETGTGKEIAATAIHARSPRKACSLVTLNCAAIQETLVESELFGYERGAFSGAISAKPGLFETASGGTVFLDEIGELSMATQAKLLRALETKRIIRLGDVREREIDIRLVAATNRNLLDDVETGRFRRDLYFRLSGAVLTIPPLRERPLELTLLAQAFLTEACARLHRSPMTISANAIAVLSAHHWPGNLRELKNLMDYVAAAFVDAVVDAKHLAERLRPRRAPPPRAPSPAQTTGDPQTEGDRPIISLADEIAALERTRIKDALVASRGNHAHAARSIGMPLRTFFAKVKKYRLGSNEDDP